MNRSSWTARLAITALSLSPMGSVAAEEKVDVSDAYPLIEAWLGAQRDYDRLPGLSAAIVDDQELVWSQSYGLSNPEGGVRAETNTIYSICSISKVFTAVAIMRLRDAGKLRLDDRIGDLLPDFDLKQQFAGSGPITIRSILSHSSGLPREADLPYWTGPDFPFPTREEIHDQLGKQQTLYPASTYYQYSNLGVALLGDVVSVVSGVPFEDYVTQNILLPLRLQDTRTHLPEEAWGAQLAVGHGTSARDGSLEWVPVFQARGLSAAFGLSSTVEDLGRFASWQFRLREQGGVEILKAATLREMHRVHWIDPDWKATWGLGFRVWKEDDRSMVGHSGFCPGYRTSLTLDPKHASATIVMINASGVAPTMLDKGMRAILKKARKSEIKVPAADGVDLDLYAGRYDEQPWGAESVVRPWKGGLVVLNLPTHEPAEGMVLLQHVEGDTFRRVREKDDALGEEIVFEKDEAGRVTRMWRHANFSRRLPD